MPCLTYNKHAHHHKEYVLFDAFLFNQGLSRGARKRSNDKRPLEPWVAGEPFLAEVQVDLR